MVAVTANESVARKLSLVFGVFAKSGSKTTSTDEMLENAVEKSIETGYVRHGDLIVITAGVPVGETGTTNLMKVYVVGDIIAKGQRIGRKSAFDRLSLHKAEQRRKNVRWCDSLFKLYRS
ncbi:pyruvate kinase alpha/beta domain-containing protein [Bacillus sp. SL00103]